MSVNLNVLLKCIFLDYITGILLGIDLGTTSVKTCLFDSLTHKILARQSKDTQANVPSEVGCEGSKQDVPKIIAATQACVNRLPKEQLKTVQGIGISGQMHGVMLWSSGNGWQKGDRDRFEVGAASRLYTWQDGRCDAHFLVQLPQPHSHLRLASGYGCATLFWKQRHQPEKLKPFNQAGTVQDFLVAMLCNLPEAVMSVQSAASWGYFDTKERQWNREMLEKAEFPVHLLPKTVLKSGEIAGHLATPWCGLPAGTPVGVALGDMQCSVLSTICRDTDAVLNISTSAQLSFVMPPDFAPDYETQGAVEYFPYFDGRYLAVAASLNGGNVLASFVRLLQQWLLEFGYQLPQARVWDRILALAAEQPSDISLMDVHPTLFGERHLEKTGASVGNIRQDNMGLGNVTLAISQGVIQNLHNMMSHSMLQEHGIGRILGTGSALLKNALLQNAIKEKFPLQFELSEIADAAMGACIAIKSSIQ